MSRGEEERFIFQSPEVLRVFWFTDNDEDSQK